MCVWGGGGGGGKKTDRSTKFVQVRCSSRLPTSRSSIYSGKRRSPVFVADLQVVQLVHRIAVCVHVCKPQFDCFADQPEQTNTYTLHSRDAPFQLVDMSSSVDMYMFRKVRRTQWTCSITTLNQFVNPSFAFF